MQLKFQIPGIQVETPRLENHTQQSLPHIEVKEFQVQTLRTGAAAAVVDCESDDVFEFVMDDDTVWYFRADDLARRLKTQKRTIGESTEEVLQIPDSFEPDGGSTRGFLGDLIKQKIIRLFTNWAAERTAEGIARLMEGKLNTGLFHIDKSFNLLPKPDLSLNGNAPHLLLIHGTGSNIIGGFKSFLDESENTWSQLIDHYNGRVLGFEHRTWSESPVRNAIDLVELLPEQIQLDLITHSRGGLVGEVLAMMAHGVQLSDELLNILKSDKKLKQEVEKLSALVQRKQIKVRNFIRVACPIGGTTILSKRLDAWLNIVVNSMRLIPGFSGNPVYEYISDFVKAVVHERTDPETLPGLACMRPESPLIKFLNNRELKLDSPLYVISGDARSSKFGAKVTVLLADLFFLEEHDLVVPVNSMRIGLPRTSPAMEYFSAEKDVSHFKYFQNEGSREAILKALIAPKESDSMFKVVDMEGIVQTRKIPVKPTVNTGAPTLFVIPGIMGTHLKNEESRLWASYPAIITGAMGKLAIDAKGIKPDGLHDPSYAAMVQYFIDKNYNVVTLGYDWRKNLLENAAQLRAEISKYLHAKMDQSLQSEYTPPFYFIAHSMGGLVLSLALAGEKDFQEKLKASGFRVLLLGVPWKGSFSVPRIFLGQESTVQRIALLDLKHSRKEIQGIIARYPGLIQLMPRGNDSAKTFFDFWNTQIAGSESDKLPQFETEPIPNDSGVKTRSKPHAIYYINQVEEQLKNLTLDAHYFKYIAGQDTQTPNEFRIDGGKEIKFRSTPAGDGRVPWDTIPEPLRDATYYVPAVHGDLASHEKSFDGYLELLEKGSTDLLSRHEPATRSVALLDWLPQEDLVEYPTARDIDFAIGGRPPQAVVPSTNHKVSVTLTHGDLVHAAHPIMVGHFKGDAILNAEKVMDDQLDDQLSLRKQMGYYPEEVGSNIILIPTKGRFKGGIVVGLGEFGTLTEPNLYQTLHSALVSYLLKVKENGTSGEKEHVVGVSALLIGSGFGSLMIANSVKALFDAVTDVNRLMAQRKDKQLPLIGELEIIELFRYKAVQTSRLIQNFVKDSNYQHLAFNDKIKKVSGRRDVIPDEVDTGWWHRIKVWHPENARLTKGFDLSELHFTSLTDRARAEEKKLRIDSILVNDLVASAAKYSGADIKLSKTLFELLVPNEFKTYASGLRNMVLIVDKETARYPWELMSSAEKGNELPISIKAGLIRQLITSTFRQNVEDAGGQKAMVVGDPPLNGKYSQLPGAAEEAKQVVKILGDHGYEVDDHIQKPAMGILKDLMSTPYRILHFAAHGIFNDPVTGQTGIVLGDQSILTPSIFKQMRYVPDLVFVNCCSLGKIDTEQEKLLQSKFEVAASIGCELAEIGVKAVIVAGWEVEDKAAKVFSELVYNKLLNGVSYGKAVQDARGEIYRNYGPHNNTWGAYQCYGDPFFTLKVKRDKSERKTPTPPDAEEAILLLENFINRQDTSFHRRNNSPKKPLELLQDIDKAIVKFKDDSRVVEKLAEAYGKIGELKLALDEYQRLGNFEKATFSYKALEQMYNTRVRLLEENYMKLSERERDEQLDTSSKQLREVVKGLESLLNFGKTKERYALIGSACKRGFMMFRDKDNLEKSAEAYLNALKIQQKNGADYYSFFNYATAYELLAEKDPALKPTEEQTKENINNAEQREMSEPDFWNKTAPSMVYLWELIKAKEEEVTDIKQKLVTNFREAWKIEGNSNNKKSHLDQFKFVRIGIEQNDKIEHCQLKINALNEAEAEINRETD